MNATRTLLALLAVLISSAALHAADAVPPAAGPSAAAALKRFVDGHVLAGAVMLVADKEKTISLETVGFADIAAGKPMSPDCLFWIASQSKPITATAFMILVDEGKVNIDDPVEKYLPEFKGQKLKDGSQPKHPITVRNVLSHTSGLPFKTSVEEPTLDVGSLADRVKSYATTPLDFEPDTKYQYSNAGINTAGRIIEIVSGMPYETFLDTRLFGPLGMKDTTFWPNAEQISRLAKSYKPSNDNQTLEEITVGQLKYPLDDRTRQPMPAGGLFSTASDLEKFCQMVLAGGEFQGKRILSEAAVKTMTSKQTGDLPTGYGLGWSTGGSTFGHGGAYATDMSIDTSRGLIRIWLVQHAGFANPHDVFNRVADEQFTATHKAN
ncbi:MAG TPA: serine hydrolase domain-containing protein [Pirellulales bacterium]|nr:serine hydrolase domain-containing protein [Pirellulales bacterium]